MIEKNIVINLEDGVHARPAAMFVEKASSYDSNISIKKDDVVVNAKSIMSIMMLALTKDTEIFLIIDGEDEIEAMDDLYSFMINGFKEV